MHKVIRIVDLKFIHVQFRLGRKISEYKTDT